MALDIVYGRRKWGMVRDKEGQRTYKVTHRVKTTDTEDGPATILDAAGIPTIGSTWSEGNDADVWAFCTPDRQVQWVGKDNEGGCDLWDVTSTFSTIPTERCQDDSIENPILEPARISGSFTKLKKEAIYDRNGDILMSSSQEPFKGPEVEFDDSRPTVRIGINVLTLPLTTFAVMIDTVNDAVLWGLAARCVKLTNVSWSRLLYGTCTFYYSLEYEFEINYNTFDKELYDIGTRCLKGKWSKDGEWTGINPTDIPTDNNPNNLYNYQLIRNYTQYQDDKGHFGNNGKVFLDGQGRPAQSAYGSKTAVPPTLGAVSKTLEYYEESNFLTLGIPTSL